MIHFLYFLNFLLIYFYYIFILFGDFFLGVFYLLEEAGIEFNFPFDFLLVFDGLLKLLKTIL
jgi:hypothetical protein